MLSFWASKTNHSIEKIKFSLRNLPLKKRERVITLLVNIYTEYLQNNKAKETFIDNSKLLKDSNVYKTLSPKNKNKITIEYDNDYKYHVQNEARILNNGKLILQKNLNL